MSFRKKLLIAYILIALLPLTFSIIVGYFTTKDTLISREITTLEAIADAKVIAIKNYIDDFRKEISVAQDYYNIKKNLPILSANFSNRQNPDFLASKKQLDDQFGGWSTKRSDVVDVMLVGVDGRIVYASNQNHQTDDVGSFLPDEDGETYKNGKEDVYVSNLFINKVANNRPSLLAAAPIRDLNGVFVGLVVFEIDAQELFSLIQDTTGLGETGETQIAELFSVKGDSLKSDTVVHNGDRAVFLSPLRFDLNAAFKREEIFSDQALKPAQLAVSGKSGNGVGFDYRNKKVLAVWRYIPSRNWGLVTKMDYEEVLAPVNNILVLSLIILSVLSILVIVFSWFISGIVSRSVEEVNKSKGRLDLATKSAKIGVWEWNIVKNIITWDDQMYSLYGIEKEAFGGAYEAWQAGLHPDDKKSGDDAIQSALKGEKEFNPQFRVVWPNGEIRFLQAHAVVERDASGKPVKMVGVNWDITKEKEIDKQKTEFVSLASHQLKTPIGSIQWDLEMLLAGDYGPVSETQKEILNEAYTMSNRMNDLVNALLNISRIEMGVFIIELKPTDLVKLCEEVIKEMGPRLIKKQHEVIRDFSSGLNQIMADEKLLRIVYQNFISNAIKYTPDKGKIKLSFKIENGNVIFSVANNGEPIPRADQSRIFSKMFRASNAQEQDPDGNGLGLYVVKQIVENAGGKVWFSSKKGEDTVFYCSFPLSGMLEKNGTKRLS